MDYSLEEKISDLEYRNGILKLDNEMLRIKSEANFKEQVDKYLKDIPETAQRLLEENKELKRKLLEGFSKDEHIKEFKELIDKIDPEVGRDLKRPVWYEVVKIGRPDIEDFLDIPPHQMAVEMKRMSILDLIKEKL